MINKFELKHFPDINNLNDCQTSSIELINKRLIFNFDKEGLDILLPDGKREYPYNKMTVTYILNQSFDDSGIYASVRLLDSRKYDRKIKSQYWTLSKFTDYLHDNKKSLRFYDQYFNHNRCIIFAEILEKDKGIMFNQVFIELIIDEIIFEGVE